MKVLVVDDIKFSRRLLSNQLMEMGHWVIEAENGEEAVLKSKNERPDVIFVEMNMSNMDSIITTKKIHKEIGSNIVACSDLDNRSGVVQAIKAGASDYLLKPYNDQHIKEVINRL